MTEVHQYWTNLKELVLVAVVALAAAAGLVVAAVAAAVLAVAALEVADHPVWEDCSRPACRS